MIQFTAHMRILVATSPLDMRKGIDGTAALCRLELGENPMGGAVFLFLSRSRKMVRILSYDGQGFWLCSKRLSSGRFPHWVEAGNALTRVLEAYQAQALIHGCDPSRVRGLRSWKKIIGADDFTAGVG